MELLIEKKGNPSERLEKYYKAVREQQNKNDKEDKKSEEEN